MGFAINPDKKTRICSQLVWVGLAVDAVPDALTLAGALVWTNVRYVIWLTVCLVIICAEFMLAIGSGWWKEHGNWIDVPYVAVQILGLVGARYCHIYAFLALFLFMILRAVMRGAPPSSLKSPPPLRTRR